MVMDANYDCVLLGKRDISVLNVGMANKINSCIPNYSAFPFAFLKENKT